MHSLQKNMCDTEPGQILYNSMFVWNEFLSRGIRNLLHNTIWTVALVYGFFKQVRFFPLSFTIKLWVVKVGDLKVLFASF